MALDPRISKAVFDRDDWRCRHCNSRNGLHPHHVIYVGKGGPDTLDNLLTLCWRCHSAIHDGFLRLEVIEKQSANLVVRFWKNKGSYW